MNEKQENCLQELKSELEGDEEAAEAEVLEVRLRDLEVSRKPRFLFYEWCKSRPLTLKMHRSH